MLAESTSVRSELWRAMKAQRRQNGLRGRSGSRTVPMVTESAARVLNEADNPEQTVLRTINSSAS
jgi:hypothetical protein